MDTGLALMAGSVSSIIFAGSVMPMLLKAIRTRDLASYSLGNLLLANTGNLIHSVYIYSLPAGPIWVLHAFYLVTTGFMLVMYLRHRDGRGRPASGQPPVATAPRQATPAIEEAADLLWTGSPGGTVPQTAKEAS